MTTDARGFTLIEVIVAITIFSVGILSIVATSSLVTRMVGEGQQYSEAGAIANHHIERLRDANCTTSGSGVEVVGAFAVTWTADSVGSRTPGQRVAITVTFPTASGVRSESVSSVFACPT